MTSATRPEKRMSLAPTVSSIEIERAVGIALARLGKRVAQLRDLRGHGAGAAAGQRAFARALRVEQAHVDGRAGAGERDEGHGDLRVLDRERERGAKLIAVERAMARRRHPARAVLHPVFGGGGAGAARIVVAGLVGVVAEPARPEIFAARGAEKAPEAEADVVELDRPVGIAFAGRDRVAEAGDEQIADHDLGRGAVDAVVRPRDADGRDRRLAVAQPRLHRIGAGGVDLLRRNGAVVEAPVAGRAGRHRADEPHHDLMGLRRQIILALAVAIAGLGQRAGRR